MRLTSGERWRGLGERGRGPCVSPCDTFAEDTLQQFVHIGGGITGAILLWEILTARLTWFLFPDLSAISCSPLQQIKVTIVPNIYHMYFACRQITIKINTVVFQCKMTSVSLEKILNSKVADSLI